MTPPTRAPDGRRRPVVLVGGSQSLQDQVARACAAAGVTPYFAPDVAGALAEDPVVLLMAADLHLDGLSVQRDVIVVGTVEDEPRVWGVASNLPSSSVVILPQGASWLAECIGRRLNPAATGSVVGVLGAAGGCGASTFAYWCARAVAGRGDSVVLIDGQPLGGGLDLTLGLETTPGVRWNDLTDIRGTLSAEQFAAALPTDRGVALLSHAPPEDAEDGLGGAMRASGAVIDAARGAFELSVIDLGSAAAADRSLTAACDHLLLMVPARHRSIAAASAILHDHASISTAVVLRGPVTDGLDAWLVADLLGRPGPLPYVPFVRGVSQAEATGRTAGLPVPRKARRVVDAVSLGWGLRP